VADQQFGKLLIQPSLFNFIFLFPFPKSIKINESLFDNDTPKPARALEENIYGGLGYLQFHLVGYIVIFDLSEFAILG
jgi:hypothetical protein